MLVNRIIFLIIFSVMFSSVNIFSQNTITTIDYSNLSSTTCAWSSIASVSGINHERSFGSLDIVNGTGVRLYTKLPQLTDPQGSAYKVNKSLNSSFNYIIKITAKANINNSSQLLNLSTGVGFNSNCNAPFEFTLFPDLSVNSNLTTTFQEFTFSGAISNSSNSFSIFVIPNSTSTYTTNRSVDIEKIVIEEIPCNLSSPSSLTLTPNTTSPSISASWPAVSGASSYRLRIRPVNGSWGNPINVSTTNYTFNNLIYLTDYEVEVHSVCANSFLSNTPRLSTAFLPCPTTIPPASNVAFTQDGPYSGNITFSQQGGLTNFIQYKRSTETYFTTTSLTNLTNLVPYATYQARISTTCNASFPKVSNTINFTVQCYINNLTPTVSVSGITKEAATLTLNTQMTGSIYQFEYKRTSQSTWTIVSSNEPSVTTSGLSEGSQYQVRLKVSCNSVWSPYSNIVTFTTLPYCPVPLIQITDGNSYSQNAFCYQSNGGTYFWDYKRSIDANWNTYVGGSNVLFAPLQSNTQYQTRVRYTCSQGYTPYSNIYTFTTGTGPDNCSFTPFNTAQSTMSGKANLYSYFLGGVAYLWEYKLNSSSTWTSSTGGQNSTISGLTSGSLYNFRHRVVCSGGTTSPYSPVVTITIL